MDQGEWEPDEPFNGTIIAADQRCPGVPPEPGGQKRLGSLEPQAVESGIIGSRGADRSRISASAEYREWKCASQRAASSQAENELTWQSLRPGIFSRKSQ